MKEIAKKGIVKMLQVSCSQPTLWPKKPTDYGQCISVNSVWNNTLESKCAMVARTMGIDTVHVIDTSNSTRYM
jgi:hypothetical protein